MAFLLHKVLLCYLCASACSLQDRRDGANQATMVVYVDREAGEDDSCLSPPHDTPCSSLEAIATGITSLGNLTSLEVVIKSQVLELKEPVKFSQPAILSIVGAPTLFRCANASRKNGIGAVFEGIKNLTLENITFVHCGKLHNYKDIWEDNSRSIFRAAVHVLKCTNVTATRINASWSVGAGMVVSRIQELGLVKILHSVFEHNTILEADRHLYAGGGGLFIQMCHSPPSTVIIHNCTFANNIASTTAVFSVFGSIHDGRGLGGGLVVRLANDATSNRLTISNCTFIRNSAFFGGGLSIQMSGQSRNNSAEITGSHFEENGCLPKTASGGGVHLGYTFYGDQRDHVQNNTILVQDTVFTKNCAELGGGATFFSSRSKYQDYNNSVQFINCSWTENSGCIGAAVDVSPHIDDRLLSGFLPTPEFINCRFLNNSKVFRNTDHQEVFGAGALFSSLLDIKFISSVHFEGNKDSALILINSIADFSSCNAMFLNNTGVQGGAISLVGVSSMVVGPDNVYTFLNNKATDRGGAINVHLIDEHDFSASHSCFIQYSNRTVLPRNWTAVLNFTGNTSPFGRSIFATAINPCKQLDISSRYDSDASFNQSMVWNVSESFRWPHAFVYDKPMENQIATDGARIETVGEDSFSIIPGNDHLFQVNITDDFGQSVNATIRVGEGGGSNNLQVNKAFTCTNENLVHLQLSGKVGGSGKLTLEVDSPRKPYLIVNITALQCPVGFILKQNECVCNAGAFEGLSKCIGRNQSVYIRNGFWAGYVHAPKRLVTAVCPVRFCGYNNHDQQTDIILPRTNNSSILDTFICGPNRTGILCGNCTENHATYYHSPYFSCKNAKLCKWGWLFYILSELVPATLLFVIVLVFNISFTSGRLNGFILFSQLLDTLFIDANEDIKVPEAFHYLTWGCRIVYGFLTLDFFAIEPLSFCLWKKATALDILAFKYVTIVYSLCLVFGVIVFMKYFARRLLGKRLKVSVMQTSVIHGLSTFLVLCYMQCVKVSWKILMRQTLKGSKGVELTTRVWLSGELEFFSQHHLKYAIPALALLITQGVLPPLILVVYPLNTRIAALLNFNGETHPRLFVLLNKVALTRLKPILDSFQGCFKDRLRFFAGIYFMYRWVGLFAYIACPELSGYYAILQAVFTIMLTIHTIAQPYENRWHNLVDTLLLTDLAMINLVTVFNYYYTRATVEEVRNQRVLNATSSLQFVLMYLPISCIATYFVIKGCRRFYSWKTSNGVRPTQTEEFPDEREREMGRSERMHLNSAFPKFVPPAYTPL